MEGARFRLVVKRGPAAGKVFLLDRPEVVVGRSNQSDFPIAELEISRLHARFLWQGAGYLIEDLGSTNGTFVNGERLRGPRLLQPGDEIRLGPNTVMVYEPVVFDEEATRAAEPVAAPPTPSAPPPPPPRPATGSAPAPAPAKEAPPPEKKGFPWGLAIGLLLLLLLVCVVGAALWYIDANYLWCTVFPFLAGCP